MEKTKGKVYKLITDFVMDNFKAKDHSDAIIETTKLVEEVLEIVKNETAEEVISEIKFILSLF